MLVALNQRPSRDSLGKEPKLSYPQDVKRFLIKVNLNIVCWEGTICSQSLEEREREFMLQYEAWDKKGKFLICLVIDQYTIKADCCGCLSTWSERDCHSSSVIHPKPCFSEQVLVIWGDPQLRHWYLCVLYKLPPWLHLYFLFLSSYFLFLEGQWGTCC